MLCAGFRNKFGVMGMIIPIPNMSINTVMKTASNGLTVFLVDLATPLSGSFRCKEEGMF